MNLSKYEVMIFVNPSIIFFIVNIVLELGYLIYRYAANETRYKYFVLLLLYMTGIPSFCSPHHAEENILFHFVPKLPFHNLIKNIIMRQLLSKVARKMGLLGVRITVVRFSRGKVRIIQSVFPSDDWEVSVNKTMIVNFSC